MIDYSKTLREDYKIRFTSKKYELFQLLIGREYLHENHGYQDAKFLITGNNQHIRSCSEKIFNELHEDYIEITDINFINKFKKGYCGNCGGYLGQNIDDNIECSCGRVYKV